MNKKKLILVAVTGVLTDSLLAQVKKEHPDADIDIRTPEEHAARIKQEKVFERPPIKFEAPELFPEIKPYFGEGTSPIDAIGKRNKFGKHRHW